MGRCGGKSAPPFTALPFGEGKTFLPGANGLVDRVAGRWELSGVLRFQSGGSERDPLL